jgi:hypothetical protein
MTDKRKQGRSRASIARGRRLALVDNENIVGGARLTDASVRWGKNALSGVVRIGAGDHVVVGSTHVGVLQVAANSRGVRHVVRSGPDGADWVLLDVLVENVPDRFGEVVLASGDGIFAPAVSLLAESGVATTVVGRRGCVARRLRTAASRFLYVPDEHPTVDSQAAS